MNQWLAFVQTLDTEYEHVPAERHRRPVGLSRREKADDDDEYSEESDILEDDLKYFKSADSLETMFTYPAIPTRQTDRIPSRVSLLLQKAALHVEEDENGALELPWNSQYDWTVDSDTNMVEIPVKQEQLYFINEADVQGQEDKVLRNIYRKGCLQ